MATMGKGGRAGAAGEWLSSGGAAQYLHLSVDTINDLADRGVLPCKRTEGAHRRFRRRDLDAYQKVQNGEGRRPPPAPTQSRAPMQQEIITPAPGYYYDPERDDVFPLERKPATPPPAPDPAVARVPELKRYGLSEIPWGTPDSEKGKVVRALEEYVTATNIPAWVGDAQARDLVRAKVQDALKPYRTAVAQREQDDLDDAKVKRLISTGDSHAFSKTLSWHYEDRERARRAVARRLKDVVEPDWSDDEVKDEVEDVLADWDDDGDDDVDDEEGDPEEG